MRTHSKLAVAVAAAAALTLTACAPSDNADTDYEEFKGFDISEYADTAARIVLDILRRM